MRALVLLLLSAMVSASACLRYLFVQKACEIFWRPLKNRDITD
jgi:hypothetical protein